MRKVKTIYVSEKDWEAFKKKHSNISERLRYLIKLDLEGKLTLPKDKYDSETD